MNTKTTIDTWFKRYADPLFRWLQSFRLGEDETYDVIQRVFMKVLEEDLFKIRNPKAYLFRIGRNLALNEIRRKKWTQPDEKLESKPSSDPSSLEHLLTDERNLTLMEAYAKLPILDQELLSLRFGHEFSIKEIAEVLGKQPGTIKTALHRSREKLKELVAKEESSPETTRKAQLVKAKS